MITGFNTDIVHGGVTYHVQTEDKGVDTPLILSLVYDRGTILASKRTPYDDLIEAGFDEQLLAERLQKQHKLICAAVRAGRIEDLKQMTAKDAAQKREAGASAKKQTPKKEVVVPPAAPKSAPPPAAVVSPEPPELEIAEPVSRDFAKPGADAAMELEVGNDLPPADVLKTANLSELPPIGQRRETRETPPAVAAEIPSSQPVAEPEAPREARPTTPLSPELRAATAPDGFGQAIPQPKEPFVPAIPQPNEELVWDLPLQIIEEDSIVVDHADAEPIIAADAVEILTDADVMPRPRAENLEIEFLNETNFRAGERKTLNIRVFRGQSENFIGEAQVMVKVLGSSFRPLIFHARTNTQGIATVHLQLPQFRSGRGAILVRAISDGEEAELRQIVKQN